MWPIYIMCIFIILESVMSIIMDKEHRIEFLDESYHIESRKTIVVTGIINILFAVSCLFVIWGK